MSATTRTPHRPRRSRSLALAVALALALLGAACGNDAAESPTSPSGTGMDMSEDHDFTFGEPADAASADRTVELEAMDTFAFDPDAIDVEQGETITFEVHNTGQIVHSFVLGDQAAQDEHEEEMQEMSSEGMDMGHDEPNTIEIPAGETGTITWHFTEAGEVLYGCHQAGHYDAGMVGTITVQ